MKVLSKVKMLIGDAENGMLERPGALGDGMRKKRIQVFPGAEGFFYAQKVGTDESPRVVLLGRIRLESAARQRRCTAKARPEEVKESARRFVVSSEPNLAGSALALLFW